MQIRTHGAFSIISNLILISRKYGAALRIRFLVLFCFSEPQGAFAGHFKFDRDRIKSQK